MTLSLICGSVALMGCDLPGVGAVGGGSGWGSLWINRCWRI